MGVGRRGTNSEFLTRTVGSAETHQRKGPDPWDPYPPPHPAPVKTERRVGQGGGGSIPVRASITDGR